MDGLIARPFFLSNLIRAVDGAKDSDMALPQKSGSVLRGKRFLCAEDNLLNAEILEATRAIRAGENPLGQTIPILAMTANAFKEDAEKCFAAGMNAHLTKPLRPEEMVRAIARCCDKEKAQ